MFEMDFYSQDQCEKMEQKRQSDLIGQLQAQIKGLSDQIIESKKVRI